MKITAKFAAAAFGAVAFSSAALAGSVTPPGERAGLDLASPLPEGVYFLNIGSVGSWRGSNTDNAFDYDVPILAWSTPWSVLGGRIQLLGAVPVISASSRGGIYERGLYNPFVAGQIAWNLGNGFSVSYLAGAYIGITGTHVYDNNGVIAVRDPLNQTTFHQQLALAWHGDGWNATANLMYGIVGDNDTAGYWTKQNADYFNYDLGLTKTLGKWEIGIVGYGSTDVGTPRRAAGASYVQLSQFALGGLIGYNFGPVITQATVSSDVTTSGYAQKETRGVLRTIIPLWNPEAPKAVVAKY
ncbi:Uncharacterized conserved protein [Rhodoblastus acidophilus]|uniref:Uncharacterized conserved protein n=1 Tax=Rhodoblastus acidophilus TaxID=1074 RepID=A0A212RT87_RHOAC|nr:transporter [Rhodoblastus acidophilus]PPQ40714.1 transporter [Rhodoblastus acidophilus]RAI21908.1 transporter [Rhodoblastus acidophilus]SNB75815.1 Uncharacterized conserved protein [Rhodoblastus acidophilus]